MNSRRRVAMWQYVVVPCLLFMSYGVAFSADEHGSTFEAPGATIYYEVVGSGPGVPLLLVNGGPGAPHDFLHQSTAWNVIAKKRRVVFYDQRGTGRSLGDHRGQTYTLKEQVGDLEALRAHLAYDRIALLGNSWGGMLASAYAAVHPSRVSCLILVDSMSLKGVADTESNYLYDKVFPETLQHQTAMNFAAAMGDESAAANSARDYISMLFYSPEKRDAFLAAVSPASTINIDIWNAVWSDLKGFDLMPAAGQFRFPVLIITGRFDINVPPIVAYRIHQAIPNSEFKVFERSGHLPFYEEPDVFAAVLERFLVER